MTDPIIDEAARVLRAGGVIALPTETVYGLAADAANDDAVRRIYAIKGRPADHPLIVHLPDPSFLPQYTAAVSPRAAVLADHFWPGPLTLIVPAADGVSRVVTGGQTTVALRVIDHPLASAILLAFGRAVAAPSANRFGRISPTTAAHVRDELGSDVDCIVDGGPAQVGVESTIVDTTSDVVTILRAGAIGPSALSAVLGEPVITRMTSTVRAPGMLASHYAPRAPLVLVEPADLGNEAARRAAAGASVGVLTLPPDPAAAARDLYATLRTLDASGYDVLLAALPPDDEASAAVRDRLTRAAAPRS